MENGSFSDVNQVEESFISPYNSPEKSNVSKPSDGPRERLISPDLGVVIDDSYVPESCNVIGTMEIENNLNDDPYAVGDQAMPTEMIAISSPEIHQSMSAGDVSATALPNHKVPSTTANCTNEPVFVNTATACDILPNNSPDKVFLTASENKENVANGDPTIEEMIASSPNEIFEGMSSSQMMTVSQKMEAEFREMLHQEKKKKRSPEPSVSGGTVDQLRNNQERTGKKSPTTQTKPSETLKNRQKATTTESNRKIPKTIIKFGGGSDTKSSPSSTRTPTSPTRRPPVRKPLSSAPIGRPKRIDPSRNLTPTTIRVSPNTTPTRRPLVNKDKTKTQSNCRPEVRVKSASSTPRSGPTSAGSHTPRMTTRSAQSKVGSMNNLNHTPGGGKVKIESKKTDYSTVSSKCGSRANLNHTPGGGKVKIESKKLDFAKVTSKCGSKDNIHHTPSGGKVKVEHRKLNFNHVQSKCGSKDNLTHTPGGGKVKIETKKIDLSNVTSKCGSTDNIKHEPQGGKVKIFSKKVEVGQVASKVGSKDNLKHTPGGGNIKIVHEKVDLSEVQSKVDSKEYIDHQPLGGNVKIEHKNLDLSKVSSKCGSLINANHTPGGGNIQIFDEKLTFKESAAPKVPFMENAHHTPGGGNVMVLNEHLSFREKATSRTDSGVSANSTASCES
uniref:Microtubule-associated protein n=1 Tax=Ciona savignyi TaxID=51511 RepID=H2YK32_CIOSA